jgi:hypothetical protein
MVTSTRTGAVAEMGACDHRGLEPCGGKRSAAPPRPDRPRSRVREILTHLGTASSRGPVRWPFLVARWPHPPGLAVLSVQDLRLRSRKLTSGRRDAQDWPQSADPYRRHRGRLAGSSSMWLRSGSGVTLPSDYRLRGPARVVATCGVVLSAVCTGLIARRQGSRRGPVASARHALPPAAAGSGSVPDLYSRNSGG